MQFKTLDEDILPRTYCEAARDLPASTAADRALIALVRLLARQAVSEWVGPACMIQNNDPEAPRLSSTVPADERS
jgi:hypothetical protein